MTIPAAFLQNGQPLPRVVPFPPHTTGLTLEEESARATGMASNADFTSECANLSPKVYDNAQAATGPNELAEMARQGSLPAALMLGEALLEGHGNVAKDEVQGLQWLSKAAAAGHQAAQTLIGAYYCFVGKQPSKGLPFIYAAAEQGNDRAQMILGSYFDEGVPGVLEPDALESLRYLRLVTDGKYAKSFYKGRAAAILAEKYAEGRGVQRSTNEAIRWYRQAHEWGNEKWRMALVRLLTDQDANQHAQEIRTLLDAATRDGDADAKIFTLDEEWQRELRTLQLKDRSVEFWTRRLTYVGSEMRSDTSVLSIPTNNGPHVSTVKQVWTELKFRQADGHDVKIIPTKGGRTMVINPGQEVIVLYAGLRKADGDATGYPYRLQKPGRPEVGDVKELPALLEEVLGRRRPPIASLVGAMFGVVVWLGAPGFASLLGFMGAGVAGWLWFRAYSRLSETKKAFSSHFDRISTWISRLS